MEKRFLLTWEAFPRLRISLALRFRICGKQQLFQMAMLPGVLLQKAVRTGRDINKELFQNLMPG
jgi:hypothetical protein